MSTINSPSHPACPIEQVRDQADGRSKTDAVSPVHQGQHLKDKSSLDSLVPHVSSLEERLENPYFLGETDCFAAIRRLPAKLQRKMLGNLLFVGQVESASPAT